MCRQILLVYNPLLEGRTPQMEGNDSSQPCNCIDGNQPKAGLNNPQHALSLDTWELGWAQRLHKMGHKAELGGRSKLVGNLYLRILEGRFPLHIKREEVII